MKTNYYNAGYLGSGNKRDASKLYSFIAASFCSKCKNILSVSWNTDDKNMDVPSRVKKKLCTCPVCNNAIRLNDDNFVVTTRTNANIASNLLKEKLSQKEEVVIKNTRMQSSTRHFQQRIWRQITIRLWQQIILYRI